MYCVSFPKSGRTYLRFMVGKYFQLKNNLKEKDILNYAENNGLIFTHYGAYEEDFKVTKKELYDEGMIWLKRNRIDTIVSFYHHVKFRKKQYKPAFYDFLRSKKYGIEKLVKFESKVRKYKHKMIIDYEDLCSNPKHFLTRVLELIDEKPIEDYVDWAVEESSFDKMRNAEITGRVDISEKDYIDKTDERQLKVRQGKIGQGKNFITEEDLEYINEVICNYN